METLGIVVWSLPGMKRLRQCLESVSWADDVQVLHAGEGEPDLGALSGSRVRLRRIDARDTAGAIKTEPGTDWVLHLWGEERVEAELGEELQGLRMAGGARAASSYRIPIRSRLLECWVVGSLWGPSPSLRLSRSTEEIAPVWWNGRATVLREAPILPRGWIGDYSAVELADGVSRIQSASDFCAARLRALGSSPSGPALAIEPIRIFLRLFLRRDTFADAVAGLALSTLAAYAALLSGAKLWEGRNAKRPARAA